MYDERAMVLAANYCRRTLRLAEEAARGGNYAGAHEQFRLAEEAAGRAKALFPAPALEEVTAP